VAVLAQRAVAAHPRDRGEDDEQRALDRERRLDAVGGDAQLARRERDAARALGAADHGQEVVALSSPRGASRPEAELLGVEGGRASTSLTM
jgi:hypothetical protein